MTPLRVLVLLAALVGAAASAQTPAERSAAASIGAQSTSMSPKWARLPASQKTALKPLATEWDALDEAHRRKWMAVARNFERMSTQEQANLHSRMTEWAALSPRDRMRARLNFAEVQRLAPESERKAKWDAYQALSDDERKALAERATPPPRGTAVPLRPVARDRLAPVPPSALQGEHGGPRIALTPPPARIVPAAAPAGATVPSAEDTSGGSPSPMLVAPPAPPEASTGHPPESPSSELPAEGRPVAP